MRSTVAARACWRCARPLADGAAICRSCGTAVPSTVHTAPRQAADDGASWVTGGLISAPTPRSGPVLAKADPAPAAPVGPPPAHHAGAGDPAHPGGTYPGGGHPGPAYPGTAYPGTPETWGGPPKPLRGAVAAVVVLFVVEIGALVAHGWARLQEAGLVADVRDGRAITLQQITDNDDLVRTTGWAATGLAVLAIVGLATFLYRATVNVRRWDPGTKHKPHEAIVCWFIPIANAVVPFLLARRALVVGARRVSAPAGAGLVVLWALLQVGGIVGRYGFAFRHDDLAREAVVDLDAAVFATQGLAATNVVIAVGLVFGIAAVLRIASLHDRTLGA
jgi:hypothetical protein